MPRPIDANALIQDFDRRGWDGVQTVVDMMPTLDAVPVVRCSECKFFMYDDYCCEDKMEHGRARENDFCSYGERKEGAGK